MLQYIFHQIWKNIFARISIMASAVLLLTVLVFSLRIEIYNLYDQLFRGAVFDNPLSYGGKPFGYEENPAAARRLYKSAIEKLAKKVSKIYDRDRPSSPLGEGFELQFDWKYTVNAQTLETLQIFFADMRLFCQPVFQEKTTRGAWDKEQKLAKRHLVTQAPGKTNPYAYALREENYREYRDLLIEADFDYLELASQKKPDSLAIMTLREEIFRAICNEGRIPTFWQKAVEYTEYQTEKEVYREDSRKLLYPEELYHNAMMRLKENRFYHDLLRELYFKGAASMSDIDWKINQSWNSYLITGKKEFLMAYIENQLFKSRSLGPEENKKIFSALYALSYRDIEKEYLYVYALAEISLRARDYNKTRSLANHIMQFGYAENSPEYRKAARLKFITDLTAW